MWLPRLKSWMMCLIHHKWIGSQSTLILKVPPRSNLDIFIEKIEEQYPVMDFISLIIPVNYHKSGFHCFLTSFTGDKIYLVEDSEVDSFLTV